MAEAGTTGLYTYDLTFDTAWGTGDFLIKCVDEDEEIEDSMTVTVLSEEDWFVTNKQDLSIDLITGSPIFRVDC